MAMSKPFGNALPTEILSEIVILTLIESPSSLETIPLVSRRFNAILKWVKPQLRAFLFTQLGAELTFAAKLEDARKHEGHPELRGEAGYSALFPWKDTSPLVLPDQTSLVTLLQCARTHAQMSHFTSMLISEEERTDTSVYFTYAYFLINCQYALASSGGKISPNPAYSIYAQDWVLKAWTAELGYTGRSVKMKREIKSSFLAGVGLVGRSMEEDRMGLKLSLTRDGTVSELVGRYTAKYGMVEGASENHPVIVQMKAKLCERCKYADIHSFLTGNIKTEKVLEIMTEIWQGRTIQQIIEYVWSTGGGAYRHYRNGVLVQSKPPNKIGMSRRRERLNQIYDVQKISVKFHTS